MKPAIGPPCPHPDYFIFDALFTLRPDGVLINRVDRSIRAKAGAVAGTIDRRGYLSVMASYKRYLVHRLVWLLTFGRWPEEFIDHINGDRSDNRPDNLRDVSRQANNQNRRGAMPSSKTGLLGVTFIKDIKKYKPKPPTRPRESCINLGYFLDPKKAHEAATAYRRQHYAGFVEHDPCGPGLSREQKTARPTARRPKTWASAEPCRSKHGRPVRNRTKGRPRCPVLAGLRTVYEAGKSGIAQRTKNDPDRYAPQIKRFVKRIKY